MNIAVIPARGGSKRIPRKNIRDFGGKPIIAYSIACALDSGLFARVVVSTEDEEIADVARSHGAEVPFMRPPELSDDHVGTTDVVAHAVEQLAAAGASPAAVCCIYPTAPFLRPADLAAGLQLLDSGDWQYVFSATTFAYPIFRGFLPTKGGGVEMLFPDNFEKRSQDLPEALHDAGQFYWGRPDAWRRRLVVLAPHSTVLRLPRWRVQDIDTEEDWSQAESVRAWIAAHA